MTEKSKNRHVKHTFAPIADEHSRILILGSVPSVKSVEHGFYYMHPQNRFWKTISAIIGENLVEMDKYDKAAALKRHGIALYDAVEECDLTGSSDSSITNVIPADIPAIIKGTRISTIFANGAASYKYLTKYHPELQRISVKMPSTSPANAACSLDSLISQWREAISPYII